MKHGVYVSTDPDVIGFWIMAEDGIDITNRIFLEPEVWHQLVTYAKETLSWK